MRSILMLLSSLCATVACAGPLTPPAGSVTPSYKTLTEIEPRTLVNAANTPGDANSVFRISVSGSYYLGSNQTGGSAKSTIKIDADFVTLDLNGYAVVGGVGSLDGITVVGSRRGIVIRNGTVRNHAGSGITASVATASELTNLVVTLNTLDGVVIGPAARVAGVTCTDNTRDGFVGSSAPGSIVERCIASGNATGFLNFATDSVIRACVARGNRADGFVSGAGLRVVDCVAAVNTGWGFRTAGDRADFDGCNAEANTGGGFRFSNFDCAAARCLARSNGRGTTAASGFLFAVGGPANLDLRECTAIFNGAAGFEIAGARAALINCSALDNSGKGLDAPAQQVRCVASRFEASAAAGADAGQGSVFEDCSVRNNTGDGIKINGNGNATIRRTQSVGNGGNGMIVVNGSIVEDCYIAGNTLNGVNATSLSAIRRCTFDANGTASGATNAHIFCNGNANFIEDNTIYSGDPGIQLTFIGGGTIVRRNMIVGTANNYGLIVAGNRVAPINTTSNLATTNPNDNFGY